MKFLLKIPRAAHEMRRTATERKTTIAHQYKDLTKQAGVTLAALKAVTNADDRNKLMVTRDELLAERARLDEALKDATAMGQAAMKICEDETIVVDEEEKGERNETAIPD